MGRTGGSARGIEPYRLAVMASLGYGRIPGEGPFDGYQAEDEMAYWHDLGEEWSTDYRDPLKGLPSVVEDA